MASSVCACSVKCCLLFTVIRLLLWKHQWAWATQDKVYIGSWGSFTCAPRNLPSNRFNWLRHRNEAPKSALHFSPGRYRLYWNRFHIGTGSRYPTLLSMQLVSIQLYDPLCLNLLFTQMLPGSMTVRCWRSWFEDNERAHPTTVVYRKTGQGKLSLRSSC